MKRIAVLLTMLVIIFASMTSIANADTYKQLEKKNTRYLMCKNNDEGPTATIEFWVTYYSPELWKLHKENNKVTKTDSASDFLTTLRDEQLVVFKIRIDNNAHPIQLNPLNSFVTLRVDKKTFKSEESDLILSREFQGENEGYIYFSRIDKKTGKDIFKNAKHIWLELSYAISPVMEGKSLRLMWNL